MLRAVVVVVALARVAYAGEHCGRGGPQEMMWRLERSARYPQYGGPPDLAASCLHDEHQLAARIVAACTLVLDRDPEWPTCYVLGAAMGASKLGKHDVFAWLVERPRKPGEISFDLVDDPLALFAALGDTRAVALVIETWETAERHPQDGRAWRRDFADWRVHAAAALGALGDKATAAWLDAHARDAGDARVAKACRAAAEAIRDR